MTTPNDRPKRDDSKRAIVYSFRYPRIVKRPQLIVSLANGVPRTYSLTDNQYDRFVALANSDQYTIRIMDSDFGVAWSMRRKLSEGS